MADQDLIAGRKWAEEVLENLTAESEDFRFAFLRHMKSVFTTKEIDPGAMTDEQSRRFGRNVLNFGVHRDKTYDECPLDYLEWLCDQNAELRRYIKSRRIQEERDNGIE